MSLSVAIIGPGRVGRALGRRWVEGGVELLGFLGRDSSSAERATRFCSSGRVLADFSSLTSADAILVAVGDDQLAELATRAAAAPPRPGSLWFHCSGRFGLEVLAALSQRGAEVGALHPLCHIPDAENGYRLLPGRDAVVEGNAAILDDLARRAGLEPLHIAAGDRAVYHAACNLAANGLTALHDVACSLFLAHGGMDEASAQRLANGLMAAGLAACREHGAANALSGPVVRGDRETVNAHLSALVAVAPQTLATYLALMRHAVMLARTRGLSDTAARALHALLGKESASD